eukprot:TRINITY_DN1347_c0_g3_i1.p1 TRINITY_DN1347_c0_g3~~TRINITY_DN1347_c0_g3_i1.p1  ORF type:complete len:1422 (-),score=381.06 TRINITY_DN1347_c0_g3_i1:8-4273(-)
MVFLPCTDSFWSQKNFVGIQKFEDLVKLLIPKTNINAQDPQTGSTVIHSAFKYASPQALNNLLYLDNFDPNLADKEGNTLLHAAFDYIKAKGGNSSYDWIINKLLEKKADPNVQNKAKFTPLWQAISLGSPTITKALLAAKADSSSVAYLCLAIQNKNEALARALIASGTPVNDLHEGIAPLHYAVRTKNKALVTLLLEAKADVNITSSGGCTPLHLAFATATSTIDSNFSLEKLLIDSGADINAIDEKGRTPLHYAFVKTLGAADNDSRSFDPITCVSGICEYKHLKIDVCDKWGRTPLHYAAIHASTISSLYLLKRGASLETKDKCGNTPLALAVYHKHTDYSIVLIQKDANLNEFNYTVQKTIQEEKDKAGFVLSRKKVLKETKQSIFRNVLSHQWQGVAHLMLDSKYDFFDAMQDAIDSGTLNFMANLLEKTTKENICRLNSQNQTLLHILSKSKGDLSNAPWEAIAQFLVNSGVSVTQTDIHGNNAIHYASRNFHWGLIQFLLKNNEDVNVKDKDGNTPIVLSLSFGNSRNLVATVKMLCNAPPADVTVEDTNGNTLFLLAIKTRTSLNNIHEIFQSFLGKNPAVKSLLNKRDKEDNTVLNLIIKRFISSASLKPPSDFVNLLKFLFQNGADVNAVDQSGSPLALVFLSYNTEPEGLLPLLQLFLEYKADMNIKFSYHTEESRSRDTGVVDTTKRLTRAELKALKEKPTGPSYSSSFLLYALRHNMKLLIAELLKPQYKIQIDAKDSDGSSALSYCIETKAWDLVDKLIAAGANPNQPNAEGITPLMTAVKTNDIALVRRLEKSEFALDLNTQDAKGKSIIHYVINPCEFGSYENVELLKLLAKLGANLELADNQNKKPLYYAMMQDDGKMANALVELGVKKMPAPPTRMSSVLGPDQWANAIDVDNDFEEYAKSLGDAVVKEDPPKPDRNLHLPHASVLSENGLIYDVLLTKTDVHYGEYGANNFYVLQVVYERVKDIYLVFTRWGRAGTQGQFQKTAFPNKEEAVVEFGKIFKSKTGNVFEKGLKFQKQPKKWRLQETKRTVKDYSAMQMKEWDLAKCPETALPGPLFNLMKNLTNISMYNNYMTMSGLDLTLFPLSKLNQSTLDEAAQILLKISKLITDIAEEGKKLVVECNLDFIIDGYDKIAELSNEYYELIPHTSFSHTAIVPLDRESAVSKELSMITGLKDVSIARKILLAATSRIPTANPIDYTYLSLNVNFEVLNHDNPEFNVISNYAKNTGNSRVSQVYKIQRKEEPEKFEKWKSLPNHYLLWHGSANSNFIGILSEGLRIAPPEAPTTGYMFGKGIYFADMLRKSIGYCSGRPSLLLLCEVALGNMNEVTAPQYMDQPPAGFNSTKALGRTYPDFNDSIVLPSGVTIPLGKPVNAPHTTNAVMGYNEYIVYNASQVRMRYLVEIQ